MSTEEKYKSKLTGPEIEKAISQIGDGVALSPSISIGMNSVIRKSDGVTSIPKFTMQGKSYVNPLGKDGNCEDVSKWTNGGGTATLDTANKVFGANAIKLTGSSVGYGLIRRTASLIFDKTKNYILTAYIRHVCGTTSRVRVYDEITEKACVAGSGVDATMIRRIVKIPANYFTGSTFSIDLIVTGSETDYGFFDGVMLTEVSASDLSLSEAELLEKYPYVDSYAFLENPYIEVRHDNLVRNGNGEEGIGWWNAYFGSPTISIENGKFKLFTTTAWHGYSQKINIKPNTSYYVSVNLSGLGFISIYDTTYTTNLRDGVGTFNSGNRTQIAVIISNSGVGTGYFDSIMLIEGTTAPTEYQSCRIERCVIEGKFTSDDSFTLENGEVSGLLNWKHRRLYGKDCDWQYWNDQVGFKQIALPLNQGQSTIRTMTKYNGNPLKQDGLVTTADSENTGIDYTWVGVADTDTGWAESIAPNADEVKAFMNGWKALGNDGSRYAVFGNIQYSDFHVNPNAFPPNTATTLTTATSNTNTITVANASIFKIGDPISVFGNGGTTITNISGNTLTVSSNQPVQPSGYTVFKIDVTGNSTQLITYCKNNIAPNYEGYQLHYKLTNPEPITDSNVHVHGDIPKLDNGDNYLYLDSGMVLGEVANPKIGDPNTLIGYDNPSSFLSSPLKNRKEYKSIVVYQNSLWDGWNIGTDGSDKDGGYAYKSSSNYDTNATYTVDYQILKTLHTSPTAITMQYQQDVLSAVSELAEGLNSRQKADSALDNLVDMSVYEYCSGMQISPVIATKTTSFNSVASLSAFIQFSGLKKTMPVVTISISSISVKNDSGATVDVPISDTTNVLGLPYKSGFIVVIYFKSGTNATYALNNGGWFNFSWSADCRGRL